MDTTTSPRKKRARRATSSDSDGERPRGRPRVDKPDESAADRRRTQIRMAQRAYRQRKESTLDDLRKRVSELTNKMELMYKAFGDYRDRVLGTDISQDHLLDLSEVATQLENLVKDARNPEEPSEEAIPVPIYTAISQQTASNAAVRILAKCGDQAQNVPLWLDQAAVAEAAKQRPANEMEVGLGYSMYMPETDKVQQRTDSFAFDMQPKQIAPLAIHRSLSDWTLNEPFNANMVDDFTLPAQLELPRTYSFQESTFGRRIFRAASEAAYRLLLDPRRRPAEYERIFRLSLMGRDRNKLIASLKAVLDKGPHEELDNWRAPLIHVGGAGTHYARRDPFGNLQPRKTSHNLGLIGPQALALLENAAHDKLSVDMTVEVAGFEGEWFDPYDVQGYLEDKGIFIDPSESFAEAEIVEWSATPSSSSVKSLSQHPQTSPSEDFVSRRRSTPFSAGQLAHLSRVNADLTQWNDFTNMELGAVGFSDTNGSRTNSVQTGGSNKQQYQGGELHDLASLIGIEGDTLRNLNVLPSISTRHSTRQEPRRKTVIVDVAKFIEVLIVSGVCLSRGPGFRRRDVDRALAISSFDAL